MSLVTHITFLVNQLSDALLMLRWNQVDDYINQLVLT